MDVHELAEILLEFLHHSSSSALDNWKIGASSLLKSWNNDSYEFWI